ncbi:MAG: Peptidase M16 domain protein [candidate division TM6 bacterium GW2011_GWF2_28_16]|nr:MAG: Peptidase M16 domain protein [candidate division TM6 bacterium GW2011_GWF2_28_16]
MNVFIFFKNKILFILLILLILSIFLLSLLKACTVKERDLKIKTKVETNMKINGIKKVVLDNGFTILMFKNTQTPKVLMQIAYDIGSWVEKSGERGLAHLIEHMIFKGTDKLAEGDIDSIARKYGADFNAFTSNDMTSYYFEVDKNNWEPFVDILADCMQNAKFDPEHLASEFKAVMQELHMRNDRYVSIMVEEAFKNIFPANHPYHTPVIGYKQDLVNISANKLKEFYKKYYRPERATLFVVGDIDEDKFISVASSAFKNLNVENKHDFAKDQEAMFELIPSTTVSNTTMYEDVKTEQMGFYWLIPGLRSKTKELASVVESVIGTGEGSRLYKRLVEQEKVASNIAAFSYQMMGAGLFLILVEPLNGNAQTCKKFVIEEIENIIKNGIKKTELTKVVKTREREHFQNMQDIASFTYEWISSYIATKDEHDIFASVNRYAKITPDKVVDFIKDYLDPFFINQVTLLPLPEDKKESWVKLKNKSEELDKLILDSHKRTTELEAPKYVNKLANPKKLEFEFPKPDREIILENGLTVLIHENKPWPIFSLSCQFKQASFLSESKEGVLLDFMMNYLMEGSVGCSKHDNVNFFENLGALYGFNLVGGSISGLSKDLPELLNRFALVLTKPDFPVASLEKLKEIFKDIYSRKNDSQKDLGVRILKNIIYKDHPYSWTFDDALEIIKNIDIKKLQELHKKYVTPKNMILSIVGSFDLGLIEQEIKNIFKNWQGKEYFVDEPQSGNFSVQNVDYFMLRDQVLFLLGRSSNVNLYHADYIPLKVLDFIAFNSLGSRLYQLREQTGLFYTAFGMFAAKASRVNGFDYMGSILNLENVKKTEKLFLNVIEEVGKNGIKPEELAASRQNYLKELIDLAATNEVLATVYNILKSFDLGFDYYDKVLRQVQNMQVQDLNLIAAKYFNSQNFAKVCVGRVGK